MRRLIFLLVTFLSAVLSIEEIGIESDKICTALAKKRKHILGHVERSGLYVRETRYFDHWRGTYQFNCRFELETLANDGIAVVIQKLDMRRNESTGECIDFIQFLPDKGTPSNKLCGKLSTTPLEMSNTFVDFKGNLQIHIHVHNVPLNPKQEINLEVVFTSYKLCAKKIPDYRECNKDLCIWKGFFNDDLVNCPFLDCGDERSCDVKGAMGSSQFSPASNNWIWILIVVLVCCVSLVFCLYFVFHKMHRRRRGRRSSRQPPEYTATYGGENHLTPSAPQLPESPKDKPPAYETLFPGQ